MYVFGCLVVFIFIWLLMQLFIELCEYVLGWLVGCLIVCELFASFCVFML